MEVSFSSISGISVGFSNINYREEMKYLQTFSISAGETKALTTTITTEPYNIEFIDSSGNVITTGLQKVSVTKPSTYYVVTVYSSDALANAKLKILY